MANPVENTLTQLFEQWAGQRAELILPLAPSGSDRLYYRLQGKSKTAIGAFNEDRRENEAFIGFSRHFKSKGLKVPEVYVADLEQHVYLQEDLGFTTLYSFLLQRKEDFPDFLLDLYKKVVEALPRLQIIGGQGLDYSLCYPRTAFDKQSMLWDLNSFKYYFLKLGKIPFDEQALEADFMRFSHYLQQADTSHFMFRDFQTRNIMIKNGDPYFIDYQGGRRGALQYDLASLLFQAKANLPAQVRQQLLDHYLAAASELTSIDREAFLECYYGYALIRSIQVFGTYGFRGLHERKEHFLSSIPFAIRNLRWLLDHQPPKLPLPELTKALRAITQAKRFKAFDRQKGRESLLTVYVNSFSYKNGIPTDTSSNGGGFVFDCRAIHNPGRYEPYKSLTGRDEPVINFLRQHSHMEDFLNNAYHLVDPAVKNYIERSFTSLMVNFGCTGGQHRSVYAADQMAQHLQSKFGVQVSLQHIEQERKAWKN